MNLDTICATATAPGMGALGIIRISGDNSILLTQKLFDGKKLENAKSHTVHYGHILNPKSGEVIDEVMVSIFKSPKTFTREDVVEISCHGSAYIQQKIIELLVTNGIRLALPGEFTQRAFINGRLDLTQAEAVADLIAAENKASHNIALNQMKGGFSSELQDLRNKLIEFAALVELELDFGEEDVEFANRDELNLLIQSVKKELVLLKNSFYYGNALKDGIPVAIVGKPNAGKSALLNVLLNEDKAIVSHIAGTTRDVIEDVMTVDGLLFRFIDTAGLRDTEDVIEKIGIERAMNKAQNAKIVLYLFDLNDTTPEEVKNHCTTLSQYQNTLILCPSKADQNTKIDWANWLPENLKTNSIIEISSLTNHNIEVLKSKLAELVSSKLASSPQGVVITNVRHYEALSQALASIQQVELGMQQNLSGELLAFHIRDTLREIGTITGQIEVDRDLLGTIFGRFCIGK